LDIATGRTLALNIEIAMKSGILKYLIYIQNYQSIGSIATPLNQTEIFFIYDF